MGMSNRILQHWLRTWGRAFLLSGLLAISILGTAQQSLSWGLSSSSSPAQIEEALGILGRLPTLQSGDLDAALLRMGFSSRPPDWTTFSSKQKLRYVYRWADTVSDENGRNFITGLARSFEEKYESLRFDPVFRQVFSQEAVENAAKVEFQRPTPTQLNAALAPEMQRMLNVLARYVDGPGFLGRYSVATRHFGLKGQHLDDSLEKKDSALFLHDAARRANPPPPIHARLNALMQDVLIASEGASLDSELANIAKQIEKRYGKPPVMRVAGSFVDRSGNLRAEAERIRPNVAPYSAEGGIPDIPNVPGISNLSGGSGGGSPERARAAAEMHKQFESQAYRSQGSKAFRASVGRAGGRGGVIAGANVYTSLGQFQSLHVEIPAGVSCESPGVVRPKGRIVVRTADGASYQMIGIDCDILAAATGLVFKDFGNGFWRSGEAIGLASIDTESLTRTFPYFLPASGEPSGLGTRHRILLHPALVDLDVGRSVAFLDLWPSAGVSLMESTTGSSSVARWLTSLDRGAVATWKWIDRPADITADGNALRVVPRGRTHMLAFRTFTEQELIAEQKACDQKLPGHSAQKCTSLTETGNAGSVSDSFDRAASVLIRRNSDFAKAEQLMRVLAVFKQARIHGVTEVRGEIPLARPRAKTPTYLILSHNQDYIAASYKENSWQADCKDFSQAFNGAFKQLINPQNSQEENIKYVPFKGMALEFMLLDIAKQQVNGLSFDCDRFRVEFEKQTGRR